MDLDHPPEGSILLVDDDEDLLSSLGRLLRRRWDLRTARDAQEGIRAFEESSFDVVLLDLVLPGARGLEVLDALVTRGATVIMLTGANDLKLAVEAMRRGAENFLTKPFELPLLDAALHGAFRTSRLRRMNEELRSRLVDQEQPAWAGQSASMQAFARHAALLARSDSTILLTGESGTGKGWLAQRIHELSHRREHPFVQVNCAGLSATFLETELFGHEQGGLHRRAAGQGGALRGGGRRDPVPGRDRGPGP